MANPNLVLKSIESIDGNFCVDIFQRSDKTFGFEEFRRDPEDLKGWFSVGGFANLIFLSQDEAISGANKKILWLSSVKQSKHKSFNSPLGD